MLFSSALLSFALVGSTSVLATSGTPGPPDHRISFAPYYYYNPAYINKDLDEILAQHCAIHGSSPPEASQPQFAGYHPESKDQGLPLDWALSRRMLKGDWLRVPFPANLVCNFPNCACTQESHILCRIVLSCRSYW